MKKHQSGFGGIETILILVIIGAVGSIGWYVLSVKKHVNGELNNTTAINNSQKITSKATQKTPAQGKITSGLFYSDSNNGQAVKVIKGATFTIQLNSTYWEFNSPSNSNVVSLQGQPVHKLIDSGPPGLGNGTVTATFKAQAVGQTTISAGRTSCGEALPCSKAQGSFSLTVIVY